MKRTNSSPFRSNQQRSGADILCLEVLIPSSSRGGSSKPSSLGQKIFLDKPSYLFFYMCMCLHALTGQFNCCCKTKDYLHALSIVVFDYFTSYSLSGTSHNPHSKEIHSQEMQSNLHVQSAKSIKINCVVEFIPEVFLPDS